MNKVQRFLRNKPNAPTPKELDVLSFIREYVRVNDRPPSLREIMKGLGFNTIPTVRCHVQGLIKKGYIQHQGGHRAWKPISLREQVLLQQQ